ncbi:hypothetical protein LTR10_021347 [Elasticomyces elasticus]|uniref:NCS1 nucleoside transporter n=1 Tax=Exophiala sideris TaxID=1016849 RepID=A0ABR0JGV2_9EURO|nr:hypothetical protein LTR10_021347 [Elasticomyces elasticus]KAK5027527.1 hypothetical protein LTR13_009459 [Exophiala sideris]KAK5032910.1 hypothetical protein LTS07_004321 [Exophiala sideris]KAK5062434.1 hypothetical protein LTR69_004793 [Exophiala sideris]KAK5177592.1 hypothetical protein LTR44_010003 [Eurotiomycetes sp. CCFEE 6388]
MSSLKRRLEVTNPHGTYAITQYISPDLVPMDKTRRTWGGLAYGVFWATGGFAIYNYSTGSAIISYGLSAKQALAVGVVSPIILVIMTVLCGMPGTTHHIGYTTACRSAWGMRGSWFAVALRLMPGFIWDGIEAFWGGQAVSTCIGSMSLRWANWDHPLAKGTLQLKDLIGFFIYYIVFLVVMWLPPEKLQRPFQVACVFFTMVIFGLLIWAVHNAGGGGVYFANSYTPATAYGGSAWSLAYGATAVLGNGAVVALSISDWTRFAKNGPKAPMTVMAIACPVFVYLAFAFGILVTSAGASVLGGAYWQPYLLLRYIQAHYNNSASSRAAVFFASASCAYAQVCVNIILNSVSAAMDLTAYSPKWINIRRGAYVIAAVGLCTNPWQITTTAATFITALSGFGIFYGPCAGILVADYWLLRQRKYVMADLYRGDSGSIYWFWHGVNWRAVVSFAIALAPVLPGYVMSCRNLTGQPNSWEKLSRLGFITGFFISSIAFYAVSRVFPPPGLGEGTLSHDEDMLVLPSAYRQDIPSQGQYSRGVMEGEVAITSSNEYVHTNDSEKKAL